MKRRQILTLIGCSALLASSGLYAQETETEGNDQPATDAPRDRRQERREAWEKMTDEERAAARAEMGQQGGNRRQAMRRRMENMSEEERQAMRERLENMSEEERQAMRERRRDGGRHGQGRRGPGRRQHDAAPEAEKPQD